jgi:integrase
MRFGEVLTLRWNNVDLIEGVLLLEVTKNGEPRNVRLNEELLEMLKKERARHKDCPWVFSRDGKERIKSFRKAWKAACAKAGLAGRIFHDLRRTGVRNLVRSGVSESVAMTISGHKTRNVFDRYNIGSERDQKEACAKAFDYVRARISQTPGRVEATESAESGKPKAIK